MNQAILIYTDGSARGNPGPGGFGIVMKFGNNEKIFSRGFRLTTNNRMELWAVINALALLKTHKHPVHIFSDSKYVVEAIQKKWVWNWQKKGFKGKKNQDLWRKYLELHPSFNLTFHWIKGHAGHPENERCDQLAVAAATSGNLEIDEGYETSSTNGLF
ncbi:MAG: ribonuclease HI [Bacteroidetes bacterium]|nr:ribonuclease HI [Bacteroidota bacterium]